MAVGAPLSAWLLPLSAALSSLRDTQRQDDSAAHLPSPLSPGGTVTQEEEVALGDAPAPNGGKKSKKETPKQPRVLGENPYGVNGKRVPGATTSRKSSKTRKDAGGTAEGAAIPGEAGRSSREGVGLGASWQHAVPSSPPGGGAKAQGAAAAVVAAAQARGVAAARMRADWGGGGGGGGA